MRDPLSILVTQALKWNARARLPARQIIARRRQDGAITWSVMQRQSRRCGYSPASRDTECQGLIEAGWSLQLDGIAAVPRFFAGLLAAGRASCGLSRFLNLPLVIVDPVANPLTEFSLSRGLLSALA